MNIFKKVESFLEEVDQQAATSLKRPASAILSPFDSKKKATPVDTKEAIEQLEKLGVSTKDLELDYDPELNLANVATTTLATSTSEQKHKTEEKQEEEHTETSDSTPEHETAPTNPNQLKEQRRAEQKQISGLEIKLRSSENQINTLEAQQTEILEKYRKLQSVFQKQKNQLVETLQQKHEFEEKSASLADKAKELESSLQTKNQLFSNLQLRFKQKSDECEIAKNECDEWKAKYLHKQSSEKETEQSIQESQKEALERIKELEMELESKQRQVEESQASGKEKETLLEQRIEEYSHSLQQAQQESQQLKAENQKLSKDLEHQRRQRRSFEDQLKEFKALENAAIQELNQKIANLSSQQDPTGEQAEQIQRLTKERESLILQLDEAEKRIADLNNSIYEFESQMNQSHQKLQESLTETNSLLQKEQQKAQTLQKEMAVRTKQLVAARERNEQIEAMYKASLREKDEELSKLQKKMRYKSSSEELERQIQQLRENIEQKQLKIDTLMSENAAMTHQLQNERRDQLRGVAEIEVPYEPRWTDNEDDRDDNAKASERITPLMALAPSLAISDSFVAKKIVSTAKALDQMANRSQIALRTHPALRLILLLYLVSTK